MYLHFTDTNKNIISVKKRVPSIGMSDTLFLI